MATKAEELQALSQIKDIVAQLGPDSYVAMAFEGCFEVAEDNIGNDWGCSLLQRAQAAEKHLKETKQQLEDAQNQVDTLEQLLEDARHSSAEADNAFRRKCKELAEETLKNRDLEVQIISYQQESMRLKAKIYDMMFPDE